MCAGDSLSIRLLFLFWISLRMACFWLLRLQFSLILLGSILFSFHFGLFLLFFRNNVILFRFLGFFSLQIFSWESVSFLLWFNLNEFLWNSLNFFFLLFLLFFFHNRDYLLNFLGWYFFVRYRLSRFSWFLWFRFRILLVFRH